MEIKVLEREEAITQTEERVRKLKAEIEKMKKEKECITVELEKFQLIPEQIASRKARLEELTKEITLLQNELDQLLAQKAELANRVAELSKKFDPVELPDWWYIGYVEALPTPPRPAWMKILGIISSVGCILAGLILPVIFSINSLTNVSLLARIALLFLLSLTGGIGAGFIIIIAFILIEGIRLRHLTPHSVFKGIIPVWALKRYQEAKAQEIFDEIIIAAPQREAFTQWGAKADPVMVGVIGGKAKFDENGQATISSAGLDKAILFEIASWNVAEDIAST